MKTLGVLFVFVMTILFGVDSFAQGNEKLLRELTPMVDEALAAFNEGDAEKFYKNFAASMAALATKENFDVLYGPARENFGRFQSKSLVAERTSLNELFPLLVFTGTFEKKSGVEIGVNFTKEGDAYKVMQMQINLPR